VPAVALGDIEMHYEERGAGKALLLVPGIPAIASDWASIAEPLSRSRRVIAYDNRGSGASTTTPAPYTTAQLAADAVALLDALELERAHVFGMSLGGMIAQELALDHPERVRTLTIGASFCGGSEGTLMAREDLELLGAAYASGEREQVLRAMWEINLSPGFRAEDSRFQAFAEMASKLPAPRPVVMQQMQACAAHDTSRRLRRISVPTLVIHGTEDRLLRVTNGRQIARLIPAPLVEMEGVGHLFWWEQPERSAELVREHASAARPAADRA
jgi:pimeloyl-ACP methyl ester carboxylesterase